MIEYVLPLSLLLSLALCVGLLISRHHLRERHAACKKTLQRVADERDYANDLLHSELGTDRARQLLAARPHD